MASHHRYSLMRCPLCGHYVTQTNGVGGLGQSITDRDRRRGLPVASDTGRRPGRVQSV